MKFRNIFSHRKSFDNALEVYKKFIVMLEKKQFDSLEKELSSVTDLRIINMVTNDTFRGHLVGFASDSNKVLKALFLAHAKEIIDQIADIQFLENVNNTLNEDAKMDSSNVNQLEDCITSRINQIR